MIISAAQCRAARSLLNWSQTRLAELAGVSRATITSFEAEKRTPIGNNLDAIHAALAAAGVEFIPENGGGIGVRMKNLSDPLSYFPFPIFNVEDLSFGQGRFGIYRKDTDFNSWNALTLIQLSNPKQTFEDLFEVEAFWIGELNSNNILERILHEALAHINGPRKPDHPSKILWGFNQPHDVYPGAQGYSALLEIDWKQKPAKITRVKSSLGPTRQAVGLSTSLPANSYEWWRLDRANQQ